MIVIDAVGQPCPFPVVKARQALAGLAPSGGTVQIVVDNKVACENLRKMADNAGYGFALEETETSRYAVTLTSGRGEARVTQPRQMVSYSGMGMGGSVVLIGQDSMGQGNGELGRMLIKDFLFSLALLETPPRAVLFFNGGIQLALQGAHTVEDLRALEAKGCRVLLCGVSVDCYEAKARVAVGEITNMMGIVEWMHSGYPVITIG